MAYNNINPQSSGQQHFIPGSQPAFTPAANDFPSFGGEGSQNNAANSQQQESLGGIPLEKVPSDNPYFNFSTTEFKPDTIKEFVPGNVFMYGNPDLNQALSAP